MPKRNNNLALIALCIGFFMMNIDVNIVNVALPLIAKNLGGGISSLQWVVDAYTLTLACLLLSAGNLSDHYGAKTAFLWGLVLFVLASLGCGLAANFPMLIFFRLLQGMAAALLVPTALALINATYENASDRAKAIGVWAATGGLAAVAGPVLSGILTTEFGWRSIFFVNIPIGIIGILLAIRYLPKSFSSEKNQLDIPGQILGIFSIAALAFSLIEAGNLGWSSSIVIMGFGLFVLTFMAFIKVEHTSLAPMFPLKFFQSKNFSVAVTVGLIFNLSAYGALFTLTLYFQQIREYSTLMTGFAFIPLLGVTAIASYFSGRVTSRTGPKLPMMIGSIIGAIGFFTLIDAGKFTPYAMLIFPLAAIGFGAAFIMPAITIAVIRSVSAEQIGIASGALNAIRQTGSLIGVAIFGTIINLTKDLIVGMHIGLIMAATACLCGCLAILFWVKEKAAVMLQISQGDN